MKKLLFITFLISFPFSLRAQNVTVPQKYLNAYLPKLIKQSKQLLDGAYMAQKLLAVTDTIPGWEGFQVKLYEYKTGVDIKTHKQKTGKVYLLNPTPKKLAMWIITTCWIVKKNVTDQCTQKIFNRAKFQSGAQFPVKGVVYEDQYTAGYYEPYVFKDGVTVYVKDESMFPDDKTCTLEQLNYYLQISNDELKTRTGQYARIVSTTREDYKAAGGKADVGTKDNRKQKWLDVVAKLYQQGLRSNVNPLMVDWAKRHLK